jgi:hypothetical protein
MPAFQIEQGRHLLGKMFRPDIVALEFNARTLTISDQFDQLGSVHCEACAQVVVMPLSNPSLLMSSRSARHQSARGPPSGEWVPRRMMKNPGSCQALSLDPG